MERGGLAKARQYPLSDEDIRKVVGGDVKIWNYRDLEGLQNIEQMFDDKGRAILLYPNAGPNTGHWVCLIHRGDSIEFFDPYGEAPEEQKDGLSEQRLEAFGIDTPELIRLLKGSGKPVYYNTHQFQSLKNSIATCGRHCAVRLLYSPYSLEKYKSVIDSSKMSPDDFVVGVSYDKIRK